MSPRSTSITRRPPQTLYGAAVQVDRDLAALLGERRGRTISRVIGHGLSDMTGMGRNTATDVGHAAMVAAVAVPKARPYIVAGLALSFLAGLSSRR